MADLVPAGQLRDLDLTERVEAELEILGFEISQHVLHFYADLLAGLGVVRSTELADRENGEMILVAGAKVATQTPAVRSGQRIIFASLDDAAGLVDLAFFESVQDRCAARLFASWLLLVRGRVRRAGAGPMAVTVNATECWDIPALEQIRLASGMDGVRAALAAGDDLGRLPARSTSPGSAGRGDAAAPAESGDGTRPVVFANGFTLSPYAETGGPGGNIKHPPRTLWHASPGSTAAPGALSGLTSWCGSRRTRSDAAERRLLRLVQRTGTQGGTGGPRPGQGHDGHPTVRVPDLGAAAVRPGQADQGDRAPERVLPAAHPAELPGA
jgi:error-prone DNA polymerase